MRVDLDNNKRVEPMKVKKAKVKKPDMGSSILRVETIKKHTRVKMLLQRADQNLEALGYTEHGFRHAKIVSRDAKMILSELGYDPRQCELAAIAGYLHDVGNTINRSGHCQCGSWFAQQILEELGAPYEDCLEVMAAVGNHDEREGDPVSYVSSAVILADKADVHRSRVRNPKQIVIDVHDRVNYAVQRSRLRVDAKSKKIVLMLEIDTSISNVVEYFEIFISRMIACRRAANFLGCQFVMEINRETVKA
jgi:metal-dependent HD superfamily phosphatase/phosphodiesterase